PPARGSHLRPRLTDRLVVHAGLASDLAVGGGRISSGSSGDRCDFCRSGGLVGIICLATFPHHLAHPSGNDMAVYRDLLLRPGLPLRRGDHHLNRPSLVTIGSLEPVLVVRAGSEQDRILEPPRPHLAWDAGDSSKPTSGHPVEATREPVGLPVVE